MTDTDELKNQIENLESRIEYLEDQDPEHVAEHVEEAPAEIVAGGLSLRIRRLREEKAELEADHAELTNTEETDK